MSVALQSRMLDAAARASSKLSPLKSAALAFEIAKASHTAMCSRSVLPSSLVLGLSEERESLARDEFCALLEEATGMSAIEIGRLLS